jgi:hypothetical protein
VKQQGDGDYAIPLKSSWQKTLTIKEPGSTDSWSHLLQRPHGLIPKGRHFCVLRPRLRAFIRKSLRHLYRDVRPISSLWAISRYGIPSAASLQNSTRVSSPYILSIRKFGSFSLTFGSFVTMGIFG